MTHRDDDRYFHNIKSNLPTPSPEVSSGAITHVDLGNKVWPFVFPKMLREEKGYATALFGKCMNGDCGYNPQVIFKEPLPHRHLVNSREDPDWWVPPCSLSVVTAVRDATIGLSLRPVASCRYLTYADNCARGC